MQEYRKLFPFFRPHRGVFVLALAATVGANALNGVSLGLIVPVADRIITDHTIIVPWRLPAFLQQGVDWFNTTSPFVLLNWVVLVLPLLFFLKGCFEFFRQYFMNDVAQRILRDLRNALVAKVTHLSLDFHDRHPSGTLVSRVLNDVGIINNSITEGLADLVYQSVQILVMLVIAVAVHPKMALASFVMLPLIALPVAKIGKVLRKLSHRSQETSGQINSTLFEIFTSVPVIQSFGREPYEAARYARQNHLAYRLAMKTMKRMNVITPLLDLIGVSVAVAFLWYGGREVLRGELSWGMFTLFLASLLSLIHPVKRVSRIHGINQQALAAVHRVFDIMDQPSTVQEPAQAPALPPFREQIVFDQVSFAYVPDRPVLRRLDLTVRRGEVVALVGLSGAGKTTLVKLLPRFYDPASGRVLIDGQDVRRVALRSLREQVAWVDQEVMLFNDTVRANIGYGRPSAAEAEIVAAAQQANAHEFIQQLPRGYDTVIGENGGLLSGGQRQRLAIARALLKDAPILILDEVTSQLDAESERQVSEAIEHLMAGRTVFVIAHRLSTIRHADRILVMQEGRIIEDGTHEALRERSGLYQQLYELQFAVK